MRTLQRSMLCISTQTDTAPARCAAAITCMRVFFRHARQLHCAASLSQCAWHMDTVDWRCWKTRVARGGMITVAAAGAPCRMAARRRHLGRCKWEKHSPCCDRLQRCATARRTAGALPDDLIVVHHHNAASVTKQQGAGTVAWRLRRSRGGVSGRDACLTDATARRVSGASGQNPPDAGERFHQPRPMRLRRTLRRTTRLPSPAHLRGRCWRGSSVGAARSH